MDSSNLNNLTVVELKEILRKEGLKVSGRKAELIDRINAYRQSIQTSNQTNQLSELPLPKDLIIQIALELDFPDIFPFCLTSLRHNELVCDNEDFWRRRLIRDKQLLGKRDIQDIQDPKQYYLEKRAQFFEFLDKKLFSFAYNGNLPMVIKTLKLGANPNHINYSMLQSPLTIAAENGNFPMVKYLIEHGADNTDYLLDKALVKAVEYDHDEIAKYLYDHGADPTFDDGWALDMAGTMGKNELANYFSQ